MAVGSHPSTYTPKIGTKVSRPSPSSIQIWSFGLEEGKPTTRCEALLCTESGHANELKWCPLPSHDPVSCVSPWFSIYSPRIVSLGWGRGRPSLVNWVYLLEPLRMGRSLCSLSRIQGTSSHRTPKVRFMVSAILYDLSLFAHETTRLVKVEPILRIELQDTSCWAFDWANSEVVAIGCTNGKVRLAIFSRLSNDLTRRCCDLRYFQSSKGWETPRSRLFAPASVSCCGI